MSAPAVRGGSRRPVSPRPPERPDAAAFTALLARTYLEVLGGLRPIEQLAPLLSPVVHGRLARQVRQRPRVAVAAIVEAVPSVVVSWVSEHACEAVAVVDRGVRVTAIAARIERHRGCWRVTDLAAPEDGFAPLRASSIPEPAPASPDAFDEVEAAVDASA